MTSDEAWRRLGDKVGYQGETPKGTDDLMVGYEKMANTLIAVIEWIEAKAIMTEYYKQ